jgi:FixJ family two-component response regulator
MNGMQDTGNDDESSLASHAACLSISPKPIVALIDDEECFRKSLVRSIQAADYKVQAFASAADFLGSRAYEVAACVVSDLRMPGVNGLELQQMLLRKSAFLSVLFLTGRGDILACVSAMKAGAIDFLEKPIRRNVLLEKIGYAIELTNKSRTAAAEIDKLKIKYGRLTPREREVFALVSVGLLNKQVAAQLGASEKTVKQHRGLIMRKMEADSVADLVLMADRMGVRPVNVNLAEAKGKLCDPERKLPFYAEKAA